MRITVLLFGADAATLGRDSVPVDLGTAPTCAEVLRGVSEQWPPLANSLRSARLAINHCFASPDQAVGPGDEVALIGPVSGG